jgi:hypothetical protein
MAIAIMAAIADPARFQQREPAVFETLAWKISG